jgi:hypothetical protein
MDYLYQILEIQFSSGVINISAQTIDKNAAISLAQFFFAPMKSQHINLVSVNELYLALNK